MALYSERYSAADWAVHRQPESVVLDLTINYSADTGWNMCKHFYVMNS